MNNSSSPLSSWHGRPLTACAVVLLALAAPGHAITITGLNGTGLAYNATTAMPDTNWDIVALPSFFTTTTAPYDAWIFTGGGGSTNVPNGWLGGGSNAGAEGFHWIGIQQNNTSALKPTGVTNDYYSMIYATTFTASSAGIVGIALDIAADNRATVFVNGTISLTNPDRPTIVGGDQIGDLIWNTGGGDGMPRAFAQLQEASGYANVVAGLNTLYIVVDDYISTPGATTFGSTGLLAIPREGPVPEPGSSMIFTMLAMGGTSMVNRRRRRA